MTRSDAPDVMLRAPTSDLSPRSPDDRGGLAAAYTPTGRQIDDAAGDHGGSTPVAPSELDRPHIERLVAAARADRARHSGRALATFAAKVTARVGGAVRRRLRSARSDAPDIIIT